ncbi:MAG: hypothetical protein FD156_1051 [Nitrospirae bacterium]|nr:MAG: hypothetical protein FD156_1051 [Nitrospirota bacterium]
MLISLSYGILFAVIPAKAGIQVFVLIETGTKKSGCPIKNFGHDRRGIGRKWLKMTGG